MALSESKTKNKKQTKNKKKKNIQIAKDWSKPHIWEYLPEDWDPEEGDPTMGWFPGEEGPPVPIDEWAKGGIAKKKTKKKKPRGVGIASRGYGKAMR